MRMSDVRAERRAHSAHRLSALVVALAVLTADAASPQSTKPVPTWTGRPEPVPVAFVYRDAVADSALVASHERARKALEAEFGGRVRTHAVENVSTASDADRVFRELAAQGYKVFFATDPLHADAAARVAAADYDVKIEQAVAGPTLINMRVYAIRRGEQAYLAGIVAAGSSAKRKLGLIASYPSPESITEVNAFALGAQSVDPRTATELVWVGARSNPVAAARAVDSLARRGVDVVTATVDSAAVAQYVESLHDRWRRIGFIAWDSDQSPVAPRAQIGAVVLDWSPFYKTAMKESFDYLCTKTDSSRGYREGAIRVTGLSRSLSPAAKQRLASVQDQLLAGQFQLTIESSGAAGSSVVPPANGPGDDRARTFASRLVSGVSLVALPDNGAPSARWGKY
jgi:basic membrane protein A and related proteins